MRVGVKRFEENVRGESGLARPTVANPILFASGLCRGGGEPAHRGGRTAALGGAATQDQGLVKPLGGRRVTGCQPSTGGVENLRRAFVIIGQEGGGPPGQIGRPIAVVEPFFRCGMFGEACDFGRGGREHAAGQPRVVVDGFDNIYIFLLIACIHAIDWIVTVYS
jgi:hypothetical protein